MPLTSGTRLGPHEILAPIGAGGMGEVYRARDTRLDREVAIKVLPESLARDPERLARFEREAKVLAALNHPHIAQIYGLEEAGGTRALVMELVPGHTLETPLPLKTALAYARQIADALEAAHERGIIHRDLKPANVMITPAGEVKVLDFGLAAVAQATASGTQDPVNSPTISMRATQAGLILGTAGYMSPEQAVGKPVDKRADIWSFGVVLYEMLAGRPLFSGETISHILADVIRADIDLSKLPPETPPAIRELLRRCLDRDARTRLRDIGEARVAIQRALTEPSAAGPASTVTVTRPVRVPWAVAAIATLAAVALGFVAFRHLHEEPPRAAILALTPPPGGNFISFRNLSALSPDGRRLVFSASAEGKASLWLRDLDSPQAHRLPGSEGASDPFWSPDGRWVGFHQTGQLKKVEAAGGPAIAICDVPAILGATWNQNDVILFGPNGGGIQRVPAGGGTPVAVTEPDRAHGEDSHRFPWFLPDGRHFLYSARINDRVHSSIWVGDLESRDRKQVAAAPSRALYAAPGYLLYVRNRILVAQPFDAAALRTTGNSMPLADGVSYNANGLMANVAVSQNGVLAYTSASLTTATLTWLDRAGKVLGTVGPPGELEMISLSPDENNVIATRVDEQTGNSELWLHNIPRHSDSRLTFTGSSIYPVWSPDGTRFAFSGQRDNVRKVYLKAMNGQGGEEVVEAAAHLPLDWSRDGRYLVTGSGNQTPGTGNDLWVLPLFGDHKPYPYLQTRFNEYFARISPDGRWLAYISNESNQNEVYVSGFPTVSGKWQISSGSGTHPVWSKDGRELYYIAAGGRMMAVEIKPGAVFQAGVPRPLFEVHMLLGNNTFEVTRDGRFLVPALPESSSEPMTVVLHWPALLH